MSDVLCVVCNEPWDQYHFMHDSPKWVAEQFNKGYGCPCCEGIPPEGHDDDDFVEALESRLINGSDEGEGGGAIAALLEDHETVNRWKQPEPKDLWQCSDCGTRVVDGYDYEGWEERFAEPPMGMHWRQRLEREQMDTGDVLEHDGYKYCACCCENCDWCADTAPRSSMHFHQEGMGGSYLCSDECLSEWQHEEAEDWWGNGAQSEVRDALAILMCDEDDDSWDYLDDAEAAVEKWVAINGMPEYEFGSEGARFDTESIAKTIHLSLR